MATGDSRLNVRMGALGSGKVSSVTKAAVESSQGVFGTDGSRFKASGVDAWELGSRMMSGFTKAMKDGTGGVREFDKAVKDATKSLKTVGGGKPPPTGDEGRFSQAITGAVMGLGYTISSMILGKITGFLASSISERWTSWRDRQSAQAVGGKDWLPKNIGGWGKMGMGVEELATLTFAPVLGPYAPLAAAAFGIQRSSKGQIINPITQEMSAAAAFGFTKNEDVFPMLGAATRAGLKPGMNVFPMAISAATGAAPEAAASLTMSGAAAGLSAIGNIRNMNTVTDISRQFGGDRATSLFEEMVKQLKTLTDQGEKGLAGQAGFMGFLSGGPGAGLGLSPETAGLVASQTAGKFRGINMFSILAQRQLGVGGSPMAFAERAQLAMLPDENLKRMGRLEEIQKFRKDGLGGTDELTSTTKLSMAGIRGFLSLFPGIDKKPGQLQMAQTVMAGQGLNLDVDTLSRISRGVETKDDTEKITDLTRDNKEIFNKVEKNTENSANYLGTLVDLYAASLTGEEGKKFIEEWLRNWKLGLGEGSPIGTGAGGVGGGARGGSWTGWEERETALLPKFNAAGQKWGVDPALLASVSKFESIGYNLDIKNPYSSATGLSQGLDKEWGEYIKETGNRGASKTNADDSIDFMGWLAAKKQRAVGSNPEAVAKAYTGFGHSSGLGGTAGEIGNIVNDIPRIRKKMNATSPETEALVGFIHTAEVLKQIADNTKQANSINMSYMDQERNKISNDPAQYDTRSGN